MQLSTTTKGTISTSEGPHFPVFDVNFRKKNKHNLNLNLNESSNIYQSTCTQ